MNRFHPEDGAGFNLRTVKLQFQLARPSLSMLADGPCFRRVDATRWLADTRLCFLLPKLSGIRIRLQPSGSHTGPHSGVEPRRRS